MIVRLSVGDVIRLRMPFSEVCMYMNLAGSARTVRLTEEMAQLLDVNGAPYSAPITWGEAGIYRDAAGPYVLSESVVKEGMVR